jgi:hypothetical protein
VVVSGSPTFPCSYAEAVTVLSAVFAAVLSEPHLQRISVQAARGPSLALLYVCAGTVPVPLQQTITIGRRAEDSSTAVFPSWPTSMSATWFENGYGRVYQIAQRLGAGNGS